MRPIPSPRVFYLIFTLSGFCGLIYESIWSHYLKLFLGHAAYAQTLVLAIFMGGMALGSALCSWRSGQWSRLLLLYALIEGIIGLLALGFHEFFDAFVFTSYESVLPALGQPWLVIVYKWLTAALMILPQSILLGMTFPLMSAGLLRWHGQRPGATIAMLYFSNSIGAVAGVLASGFILLPAVGLPGTIKIAGGMNLAVAALVWYLLREQTGAPPLQSPGDGDTRFAGQRWFRFFLGVAFATGSASFIYEIVWIRMLSLVLGASTHAFELMLSAFILGLALGGLWIRRHIDRATDLARLLAWMQWCMALLALLTLPLYDSTFDLMAWIVGHTPKTDAGYLGFNLSAHAIAMGIMLPATFCAGTTLPLLTGLLLRQGHAEKSIGGIYAANTLGAIAGVFFATHWAMPTLGLKGLLLCGAAIDLALAVAIAGWVGDSARRRLPTALAASGLLVLIGVGLLASIDPFKAASGVYRHGRLLSAQQARIDFHRDGKTASIDLISHPESGHVTISTNGKPDATINMYGSGPASPDEATMILAGVIPLALRPEAASAGVIGMGSGLSTQTLLQAGLDTVDTVEIEPAMIAAAQGFRPRVELAYSSPASHLYIDDAKTFFSTYNKRYDIIVSEPSNPWVSGTASLFTREFYRLIRGHLRDGGLLVQWLQLYEIDMRLVASVAKALAAEFGDYRLYATDDEDIVFVISNRPLAADLNLARLAGAGSVDDLRKIGVRHAQDLALHEIGDRKALQPLFASYDLPANSDYYPVLDLNAARTRFLGRFAGELVQLRNAPLPAIRLLAGREPQFSDTAVTPNAYLKLSDHAFAASLLRDYLLAGRIDRQYPRIAPELRFAAEQVSRALLTCDGTPLALPQLHTLASAVLPHLQPFELSALWQRLRTSPCLARQTAMTEPWLILLQGLTDGDAGAITTQGLVLLAAQPAPAEQGFLLSATVLGYVLGGNAPEARRLWQQFNGEQAWSQLDLADRLIVAHAFYGEP